MFQTYAVTYKLNNQGEEFGTTAVLDLEEAAALVPSKGLEGARDLLLRRMVACKRWGSPKDQERVTLTEAVRLGEVSDSL